MSGCNNQNSRTVRFDADGSVIDEEINTESEDVSNEEPEDEMEKDSDTEATEEIMEKEEEVMEEKGREEKAMDKKETSKTDTKKPNKLAITSLDGAFLETSSNQNIIEGSVSKEAHSIKINDYSLKKFIPGQTDWSYTASTNFGTLKNGWNDYVVKTYDKKGDELDSLMFSINYEGVEVAALPSVGANLWVSLLAAMITSFFILNRKKIIFNK